MGTLDEEHQVPHGEREEAAPEQEMPAGGMEETAPGTEMPTERMCKRHTGGSESCIRAKYAPEYG
jgi:hypothetical protein